MASKKTSPARVSEEDALPETDASKEFLNFVIEQLKESYWIKKNLVKAVPRMQKAAKYQGLKDLLANNVNTVVLQSERLEQALELLGEKPRVKKGEAGAALVEEAVSLIAKASRSGDLKDTAITLAIQNIVHSEIASYQILGQLAGKLGNEDVIGLLEETLAEERHVDKLLATLMEQNLNSVAVGGERKNKQSIKIDKAADVYDSINLDHKNILK